MENIVVRDLWLNQDLLLKHIVQVKPVKVCRCPVVFAQGVELPKNVVMPVLLAFKKAWIYARQVGYCSLSVVGEGQIEIKHTYDGFVLYGLEIFQAEADYGASHLRNRSGFSQSLRGHSVITLRLLDAICQYVNVLEDLSTRINNSNNVLLTLAGDSSNMRPREIYEELDSQFEKSRRAYGPTGSTMTGVNFSLAEVKTASAPFLNNVALAAGLPKWMLDPDQVVSQFMLDDMADQLSNDWDSEVFVGLHWLFTELGFQDVEIQTPLYRSPRYEADLRQVEADIEYKNSAAQRNRLAQSPNRSGRVLSKVQVLNRLPKTELDLRLEQMGYAHGD